MIGRENYCIFVPTVDSSGQQVVNDLLVNSDSGNIVYGLRRPAPQPSLLRTVALAWQLLGYQVVRNDYLREPWSRLYIANATVPSTPDDDVARCLPHWTVRTLLEQFRLLFGAVYRISGSRVAIVDPTLGTDAYATAASSPLDFYTGGAVQEPEPYTFKPVAEFQSDYDDDGSQNADASNLSYRLSDDHAEVLDYPRANFPNAILSDEARKAFSHIEADSPEQASALLADMTTRQQDTTIFDTPQGTYIHHSDRGLAATRNLVEADVFQPLIRNAGNDDTVELRMVPVALRWRHFTVEWNLNGLPAAAVVPVMQPYAELTSGDDYATLAEVITGDAEPPQENKEETETMQLFFYYGTCQQRILVNQASPATTQNLWWPQATTDPALLRLQLRDFWGPDNATDQAPADTASLRLSRASGTQAVARFHPATRTVDDRLLFVFKFLAEGQLPDPTRIFIFKGKRYQCEKLEIRFTDGRTDPLITGYFYQEL